jgi:hypothetical protein
MQDASSGLEVYKKLSDYIILYKDNKTKHQSAPFVIINFILDFNAMDNVN